MMGDLIYPFFMMSSDFNNSDTLKIVFFFYSLSHTHENNKHKNDPPACSSLLLSLIFRRKLTLTLLIAHSSAASPNETQLLHRPAAVVCYTSHCSFYASAPCSYYPSTSFGILFYIHRFYSCYSYFYYY